MGTSKNSPSQKDGAPDSVFFTEQLCHKREEAGSLLRTACQFINAAPAHIGAIQQSMARLPFLAAAKKEGRPWLRTGLPISPMLRQLRIGAFVWHQNAVQSLRPRQNRSRAIVQFSRSDTIFRGPLMAIFVGADQIRTDE